MAARLPRTAARAESLGAEADVEGFTHLKALERQPQDERWPLGGENRRGWGLILPSPPLPYLSPPPPIPSRPLPSLFRAFATPHISARIVSCNRASGGAGSPFWIPMLQNMPQPLPKCLWSDVAKGKCTQAEQLHGCQSDKTDVHISNPFTVIEESRLKCNCRPRPPPLASLPKTEHGQLLMGLHQIYFWPPLTRGRKRDIAFTTVCGETYKSITHAVTGPINMY